MSSLLTLLVMSTLLGAGAFGIAIIPLSFKISKNHVDHLSTFGTGLLLGAGFGIILPEYACFARLSFPMACSPLIKEG